MDQGIYNIMQTIQTLHELEEELVAHPYKYLFSFITKNKYKKLKESTKELIYDNILNQRWTIQNIVNIQRTLCVFYDKLSYLIESQDSILYFTNNLKENEPFKFSQMNFVDINNKDRIIVLDIISNNISFTIMDTKISSTFSAISTDEVQQCQNKIELVCKNSLIELLLQYLENGGNNENN